MATQKKSGTSAKTTKKASTKKKEEKPIDDVVSADIVEPVNDVIGDDENLGAVDTDNVEAPKENTSMDSVEKAIESVDTTIDSSEIEDEINEGMENALKPLNEVNSMIKDLEDNQKKVEQQIKDNPQSAQKVIDDEIKRVKKLKAEAEKELKKNNAIRFSGWWNGMGYEF